VSDARASLGEHLREGRIYKNLYIYTYMYVCIAIAIAIDIDIDMQCIQM